MLTPLSVADFNAASDLWDVESAALRAVAEVESASSGFLADGRPKILFEGHWFFRRLKHYGYDPLGLMGPDVQDILFERWTREFYSGKSTRGWETVDAVPGYDEYDRLMRAQRIDPTDGDAASMESCSWGRFQVMGYHWKSLGYAHLGHFLHEMHRSETAHLEACLRFCRENRTRDDSGRNLIDALRDEDWAAFARVYNGPRYAENAYDEKLARAYARHR